MTIGDTHVIVGTLTDLMIINDIGGIAATGDPTGTVTGDSAIGTWTTIEAGAAAAARIHTRSCTAL